MWKRNRFRPCLRSHGGWQLDRQTSDPRDVAVVAQRKQHGVRSVGFGARYLNSYFISILITSVALNKSLGLSGLTYPVDNKFLFTELS